MTPIVLNDAAIAELVAIPTTSPVADARGRIIGTFVPAVAVRVGIGSPPRSPYTDEELKQRENQSARPLQEIWKTLGRQ